MADNNLENVRFFVRGGEFTISQLGIDLIQQSDGEVICDPIVEAVVVSRRKSGLIEVETSVLNNDTMSKLTEHLSSRSTFDSALENAKVSYEEYAAREDDDDE